jgi:site-specific DNA-methyltransferase (adenine-specific)
MKTKQQKIELFNDSFQNYKRYQIPKAQLVIADIPYNLAENAYASSPSWYVGGDNKNGESKKAKSAFFDTDGYFRIPEYMHFCSKMLIKEPKEVGKAPAMIVFCAFEQMQQIIEYGKKYGFMKSYPLVFVKNYSGQVLKANMKIVGATEYAVVLYRDKLPKFNNNNRMIFNWFKWERDTQTPKIHPTQKPIELYEWLVTRYCKETDKILDTHVGSASSLIAFHRLHNQFVGFEIDEEYYQKSIERFEKETAQQQLF